MSCSCQESQASGTCCLLALFYFCGPCEREEKKKRGEKTHTCIKYKDLGAIAHAAYMRGNTSRADTTQYSLTPLTVPAYPEPTQASLTQALPSAASSDTDPGSELAKWPLSPTLPATRRHTKTASTTACWQPSSTSCAFPSPLTIFPHTLSRRYKCLNIHSLQQMLPGNVSRLKSSYENFCCAQ